MNEQESAAKQDTSAQSMMSEEMRILEALLFASDEVLSPATLKGLLPGQPDARAIRKLIASVNAELQKQRHPFEIIELGGGYQFRTIAYYRPWVGKLLKEKTVKKLSIQALECLAIIAYKQPLTKAEIEAIRGVISDGAMKTLLERHMITIVGRSDKPGRPLLYGTSKEFLEYFGINKLSDLPRIDEFEAMAREKMEQLSEEEKAMLEAAPDEEELLGQLEGDVVTDSGDAGEKGKAAQQLTGESKHGSDENAGGEAKGDAGEEQQSKENPDSAQKAESPSHAE
jgi:segregation and condensation protein B